MKKLKNTEILSKAFNFLIKRPDPREIMWINFAVTYLCNSRCIMCSIWKKYRINPQLLNQELNLYEVKNLLQSRYLKNLQGISFTGGEPFLRKDFADLVGLFLERYPNAFIGVATNGLNPKLIVTNIEEILDTYKPKHFSISISLDGIGETHEKIRGISNAYDRVMDTVNSLREFDINLGFDFTITPHNYKDLLKVYELSKKLGIRLLVGFAHSSDIYYDNINTTFEWRKEELKEVERILQEIIKDQIKNESLITKLIDPYTYFNSNCVRFHVSKKRLFKCYSGTHSLFLDPYGNVYPCIILDRIIGNVRDESLDELWMSLRAEEVRDYIQSNKCHCWVACEVVPSLLRNLGVVKWNLMRCLRP